MAFWGVEVKPGKPFTLKYDDGVRRRLHISQATLAIGSSKQTSLLQCNVGNKSPVLLCALLPDKTESLQLNLEFEEDDEVLFSVIGPRGVHLTGFYSGTCRSFNDDESESYGEDIANSENEGSLPRSDDDEYEDSFIDDDENPEALPPSPISTDGVDDVADMNNKRDNTRSNKRLRKKYQAVESDDEDSSWQQNTGNCIRSVLESESEDDVPISSVHKNKRTAKNMALEESACDDASKPKVDGPLKDVEPERTMPKKKGKGVSNVMKTLEAVAANHSNAGDALEQREAKTDNIAVCQDPIITNELDVDPGTNKESNLSPSPGLGMKNGAKPKKKRKERSKEERIPEANTDKHIDSLQENKSLQADNVNHDQKPSNNIETGLPADSNVKKTLEAVAANHSNAGDKLEQSEAMTNNIAVGQDPVITNELDVDPSANKESNLSPSPGSGMKNGVKPKKKRKERSKEETIPETNTDKHIDSLQENKSLEADTGADDVDHNQKPSNNIETGLPADSSLPAVEEGSENKPKKKKRKKEHDQQPYGGDNNLNVSERIADETVSEKATKKKKHKNKAQINDESMDVPNSLKGEKKSSVSELQEKHVVPGASQVRTLSNGLVIEELESSTSDGKVAAPGRKLKVQYTAKLKENGQIIDTNGKAPHRFRLGDEGIMEGWNIGLDGMRAGDKRRLIVPPSLGYASKGIAENVPPDSWMVYDVELMSVH